MARHPRRRPRPPTRVLVLIGLAAILLALVVALGMMLAPHPDLRPAGISLTPPSTLIGFHCPVCGYLLPAKQGRPSPAPRCAGSTARTGRQHEPTPMRALCLPEPSSPVSRHQARRGLRLGPWQVRQHGPGASCSPCSAASWAGHVEQGRRLIKHLSMA